MPELNKHQVVENNSKVYPAWKALFLSFYSADLYKDIAKNWKGLALSYILLVSSIICIILTLNWLNNVYKFDIEKYADETTKHLFEDPNFTFEENLNRILSVAAQIPKVTISDGEVSIKEDQPYFIIDPLTKKTLAIINTTGKYERLEKAEASILLAKTRLILKNPGGTEDVFYLKNLQQEFSIKESDLNNFIDLISQIPLVTINQGTASIAEASPYTIKDDDNTIAIIDTDGTKQSLEGTGAHVLITKDRLFIKNPFKDKVVDVALSEIDADMVYNAIEYTVKKLRTLITWMPLFITPIFIMASFTFAIFTVFIYSIVAISMSKLFKLGNFSFSQAFRLSAVAITPIIVLNLIIPKVFENQGLIYFLIAIGYIYFALKANSEVKPDIAT
jgi:hypothetical protein